VPFFSQINAFLIAKKCFSVKGISRGAQWFNSRLTLDELWNRFALTFLAAK
jgi:hypothetical protein